MSSAATISFENSGLEGASISNQFQTSQGVVFSLLGGGTPVLAQVGNPRPAFVGPTGSDSIAPADQARVGSYFLTDDGLTVYGGDTLVVTYDNATSEASADIIDVDFNEAYEIRLYDSQIGGNLLDTISLSAGDPGTGDGVATFVSFTRTTADVLRLEIAPGAGYNGFLGLGFDNFNATSATPSVVPLPATLPLLAGALGLFGMVRRRG